MAKPALRSPAYLLSPGRNVREYEVFVSSGDNLRPQRDLFESLAVAFNKQALDARAEYRIATRRWEDAVPRKTFRDGNREFRHDAATAHLVVVLLHRDLRKGTEEELLKAVKASRTQVAVIWMDPPPVNSRKKDARELRATLEKLRDEVRWVETGPPGDLTVAIEMAAILARVLVDVSHEHLQDADPYTERR